MIVALDLADASAAQSGDLALGFIGGTLAGPTPARAAGNRRLLLYDVASRDAGASAFTVSVASVAGLDRRRRGRDGGQRARVGERTARAASPTTSCPTGRSRPADRSTVTYNAR